MRGSRKQIIENPEDIFNSACHLHQTGKLEDALHVYKRLVEQFPDSPLLLYNTGLAYQELEQFSEAIGCYLQAFELSPNDGDILFNMALCYQKTGSIKEAISWYKKCSPHSPDDPDIHYNLGYCYQTDHQETEAITCYLRALKIDNTHLSSLNNLAYLYHKKGEDELAISFYKRLLTINPDHEGASHMLAALTGNSQEKPSTQYITDIFDNYSDNYEASLVDQLGYAVPDGLRQLYDRFFQSNTKRERLLDLGCGTGLSGLAFAGTADHLTGIDLSNKMIKKASEKGIYHRLAITDIEQFLTEEQNLYDCLIAADVLNYFAELAPLFHLTYRCSLDGCVFCFSTETQMKGSDFSLGKTGRFQHASSYIRKTAEQAGWKLVCQTEANLRQEKGAWVAGHFTLLVKQAKKNSGLSSRE